MALFKKKPWKLIVHAQYVAERLGSGPVHQVDPRSYQHTLFQREYSNDSIADMIEQGLKVMRKYPTIEVEGVISKYKFPGALARSTVLKFKPNGLDDIALEVIDESEMSEFTPEKCGFSQPLEPTFDNFILLSEKDPSSLLEWVNDGDLDHEALTYALEAVGHINTRQSLETLLRHLLHEDPVVREGAILGLANSDLPEAMRALELVWQGETNYDLKETAGDFVTEAQLLDTI